MIRFLSFISLALLIASCGSTKKLNVAEIRSVDFEYNPGAEINFGTTLEGRIVAIMHNGNEQDITNHRKLTFESADVRKSGKRFTIIRQPQSFDEDIAVITLRIEDKNETFVTQDTIRMNFLGGLSIYGVGREGADAVEQDDRGSRILFRDGKQGFDGDQGQSGFPGGNFEGNIWKEGDYYLVYVRDLNSSSVWRYRTRATSTVLFDLSGGRGGRGGKGGGGGDGKDGSKDAETGKLRRPGNGGDGGDGGIGGPGGNGGTLRLVIHPNASDISTQLSYNLSGGPGGQGGAGGMGGSPGDAVQGQTAGSKGVKGRQGRTGTRGLEGNSIIEFSEFDTEALK